MTDYQLSKTELQVGARGNIFHMSIPQLHTIRFEWHFSTKRVYFIRIGGHPEVGEPVADGIETELEACKAVLLWSRGYLEGRVKLLGR